MLRVIYEPHGLGGDAGVIVGVLRPLFMSRARASDSYGPLDAGAVCFLVSLHTLASNLAKKRHLRAKHGRGCAPAILDIAEHPSESAALSKSGRRCKFGQRHILQAQGKKKADSADA